MPRPGLFLTIELHQALSWLCVGHSHSCLLQDETKIRELPKLGGSSSRLAELKHVGCIRLLTLRPKVCTDCEGQNDSTNRVSICEFEMQGQQRQSVYLERCSHLALFLAVAWHSEEGYASRSEGLCPKQSAVKPDRSKPGAFCPCRSSVSVLLLTLLAWHSYQAVCGSPGLLFRSLWRLFGLLSSLVGWD